MPLETVWPGLEMVAVHVAVFTNVALTICLWTCNSGPKVQQVCEELKTELRQARDGCAVVNGQETSVMQHKLDDLKHMMQAMFASDGAGTSDSSSICTFSSWTHVGSSRCCFLPETYLKVVTEDGDVPKLARRLVQGEAVRAANGEVMQVLHPPKQHEAQLPSGALFQVVLIFWGGRIGRVFPSKPTRKMFVWFPFLFWGWGGGAGKGVPLKPTDKTGLCCVCLFLPLATEEARAVVELGAGMAFLVVSPDHRILVPGTLAEAPGILFLRLPKV